MPRLLALIFVAAPGLVAATGVSGTSATAASAMAASTIASSTSSPQSTSAEVGSDTVSGSGVIVLRGGTDSGRAQALRPADARNARDYGFALDGVTDDRAALVAMINALGAADDTLVFFGQVYVSSGAPISIPERIVVQFGGGRSGFVGPGAGQVRFRTVDGVVNVRRDFGARGDWSPGCTPGVTCADDAPALQAAIDSASSAPGGHVFVPGGRYLIASTIFIRAGVTLEGAGRLGVNSTALNYTGSGVAFYAGASDGTTYIYGLVLRNFLVWSLSKTGDVALHLNLVSEASLDHVGVGGSPSSHFNAAFVFTRCGIVEVESPLVSFVGTAFDFRSNPAARHQVNNQFSITDGDFYRCDTIFRLNSAVGFDIHGNWFEGYDYAFLLDDRLSPVNVFNVNIHHNAFLAALSSSYKNQLVFRAINHGRAEMTVDVMRFADNRISCALNGRSAIRYPFATTLSSSTSPLTSVDVRVERNRMEGILAGVTDGNSTQIKYYLDSNVVTTSGGTALLVDDAGNGAIVSSIKHVHGSTMIGSNADWPNGTVVVHEKNGATSLNLRKGRKQGTTALLSLYASEGTFLGGISADGRFNAPNGLYVGSAGNTLTWRRAVPTAGTWKAGDVVWNQSPRVGGPPGWVCVAPGTPGTWKAMAALLP